MRRGGASEVGGATRGLNMKTRIGKRDKDEDKEPLVVQRADGALGSRRQRLLLILHLEPDWLPDPP